jgi:hypothetical protein
MVPELALKIVPLVVEVGSMFGSSHGFTQVGATGVSTPNAFPPDGL